MFRPVRTSSVAVTKQQRLLMRFMSTTKPTDTPASLKSEVKEAPKQASATTSATQEAKNNSHDSNKNETPKSGSNFLLYSLITMFAAYGVGKSFYPEKVDVVEKMIVDQFSSLAGSTKSSKQTEKANVPETVVAIVQEVVEPIVESHAVSVDTSASVNDKESSQTTETTDIAPITEATSESIPATVEEVVAVEVEAPKTEMSLVETVTLSAEAKAAVNLLESSARLAEIRNSFTSNLSGYEANRAQQLARLVKTLRKAGPEAAERAIANMEAEDRDFFLTCRGTLEGYIAEIENNVSTTLSLARAAQAAHFAEALQRETEQLRVDLDRQYSELSNVLVTEAVAQVTTGYEEQFLKMSLEHSKSLEALSSRYSAAIDTMMTRVEELARVSALRKQAQVHAASASKINSAVVELEKLASQGLPLTKPWAQLSTLAIHDPLLLVAMATVPDETVRLGVSPVNYLQRQFEQLEFSIRRAAYQTPRNDIVSKVLSFVFGALTLPQSELIGVPAEHTMAYAPADVSEPLSDEFHNIIAHDHARLSRASFFMKRGDVALAVQELSKLKGSHTPQLTVDFIQEARRRLVAVQTIEVLRNHANALHKDAFETPASL